MVECYSCINKYWYNFGRMQWDGKMSMCFIPYRKMIVCVGEPLYPIKNKQHFVFTANRVQVYDYNNDIMYTTQIQLPRTDTHYSVGLTHDMDVTNTLVYGFTRLNCWNIPLQLMIMINKYVDIWLLHIIDDQSDHYALDVDWIFSYLYFGIDEDYKYNKN